MTMAPDPPATPHDDTRMAAASAQLEAAAPPAGVRGEHMLRIALKEMTQRHAQILRAATAAHRYAYGRRSPNDLRDLRRALAAAGLDAPKRPDVDDDS